MLLDNLKREARLAKAFQKVFCPNGKLTEEAKIVLSFWRDEAGARGELGRNGIPYFYDANNRFDASAAAFLLGKRRMFDLLIKYLSLDEREVFKLGKDDLADQISV